MDAKKITYTILTALALMFAMTVFIFDIKALMIERQLAQYHPLFRPQELIATLESLKGSERVAVLGFLASYSGREVLRWERKSKK